MHESRMVYRELGQPMFWKLSDSFQRNTLGDFRIREPEIVLKTDSATGVSYLRKWMTFGNG